MNRIMFLVGFAAGILVTWIFAAYVCDTIGGPGWFEPTPPAGPFVRYTEGPI